jgi:hypothetical protein
MASVPGMLEERETTARVRVEGLREEGPPPVKVGTRLLITRRA